MVVYNCIVCNYSTKQRGDYRKHITTQKHIRNISESAYDYKITQISYNDLTEKYNCAYCDSQFSTKAHKRRHELHRCKVTKKNNTIIHEKITILESEIGKVIKEKYVSILGEKEKYIAILQNKTNIINNTNNNNTMNIIRNNIYTMKPLEFLNTYCNNNPSIEDVLNYIKTSGLSNEELKSIKEATECNNNHIIAKQVDKILKVKNKELIEQNDISDNTCNGVLFTNDGSCRRYIAKGKQKWEFYTNDEPLDYSTSNILDKTSKHYNEYLCYNKKARSLINNNVKKYNDWNSNREDILAHLNNITYYNNDYNGQLDIDNIISDETNSDYEETNNDYKKTNINYVKNQEYNKILDCGKYHLYDNNNNVFNLETHQYIGKRVHDEDCDRCGEDTRECWYYIKYLDEL